MFCSLTRSLPSSAAFVFCGLSAFDAFNGERLHLAMWVTFPRLALKFMVVIIITTDEFRRIAMFHVIDLMV